ncbi:MAG: tripartite tricarboxylate transporter TctB family protein [Dongiaceae bacterium]
MLRRISQINGTKDFYAGLIYIAIGMVAFVWAHQYDVGSTTRMGPGFFPALLGLVLMGLGIASVIKGYWSRIPDPIPKYRLEPFFLILASIISFALLIDRAGLVVAIFVSVFIACFRRVLTNPLEVFLTFVALASFSGLVFIHLFGMVIPLFWWSR